mmetsp:Transcript_2218/g.5663  ORF Transcript_2218/g.5663 Transcript_2218/m.5663 type:complete len:218 (-) Transcript_2218:118-771(-)
MNTRRTYSFMLRDLVFIWSCSKGAMPGTKRMPLNSMVPSTLKWFLARGGMNSLKVVLKNSSYSSSLTSLALRTHSGLLSFCTMNFFSSSYTVFMTGCTSAASSPFSSASFLAFSRASAVASSSTTSLRTLSVLNSLMGKEMNSEYVFSRPASLFSFASSSESSFRCSVMRVPRPSGSPVSGLMEKLVLPTVLSHTHCVSSSTLLVCTVTRSATRKEL